MMRALALRRISTVPIGRIPAMTSSGSGGALDTLNAPPVDATRPEPMGPGFAAAVSAITDAFGDPTRRSIYLYVRDRAPTEGPARGVTASSVASEVGVHPNVARHHLDKLAAGGYIKVVARASAAIGARRAGRPSKH